MMAIKIISDIIIFNLLFTAVCLGFAISSEAKKDRVVYKDPEVEHFDEEHHHDASLDHDAFLGPEEARTFDNLPPDESKRRLAVIVDKIDVNKDGYVDFTELKNWIHNKQKSYVIDDADKQWASHNPENKNKISWNDFEKITYGFMSEFDETTSEEDKSTYKEMIRRDKRRWEAADRNRDNMLDKDEFTDFLHPEETEHMKDVVVEETIDDIDKNKDGKISVDEYISDMYAPDASDDQMPDWVLREKESFKQNRDKNKDGFLDKEEVKEWIMPSNYDTSGAEARHLFDRVGKSTDDKLSLDDILDHYEEFVGSQVTDFGDALMKHDEF